MSFSHATHPPPTNRIQSKAVLIPVGGPGFGEQRDDQVTRHVQDCRLADFACENERRDVGQVQGGSIVRGKPSPESAHLRECTFVSLVGLGEHEARVRRFMAGR